MAGAPVLDGARPDSGPALVVASHGTSCCAGDAAVAGLVDALRGRTEVLQSFVDVQQPDVPTALAALPPGRPAIVVPLLLSAGYHVRVDLADAASATPRAVTVTAALGPDDALIDLLVQRLREAGLAATDTVVLAAAGSSDPLAVLDCHETAQRLQAALGRPVTIGFLSAAAPTLADAVADARAAHPHARVVISTYLLAPGYFAELVLAVGADVVAEPLLAPHGSTPGDVVDIVQRRFVDALAASSDRRAQPTSH